MAGIQKQARKIEYLLAENVVLLERAERKQSALICLKQPPDYVTGRRRQ